MVKSVRWKAVLCHGNAKAAAGGIEVVKSVSWVGVSRKFLKKIHYGTDGYYRTNRRQHARKLT